MIPIAPRSDTPGLLAALALCAMLAGCGTTRYRPVSDYPVKIGRPYSVRGTTYRPADLPGYDAVGMASWYGRESGNQTANGERFRVKGISAAHTVLPLPSYVEVTALDTGRTILLRIRTCRTGTGPCRSERSSSTPGGCRGRRRQGGR